MLGDVASRVRSGYGDAVRVQGADAGRPEVASLRSGPDRAGRPVVLSRAEALARAQRDARPEALSQPAAMTRAEALARARAADRRGGASGAPAVPVATRRTPLRPDSETVVLTRRELRARERGESARPKRRVVRPLVAGALTVALVGGGIVAYSGVLDLGHQEAAFVVGNVVASQTDELARARTVDTTYRAAASVSRNERRTAITVAGARTAAELEAKVKVEAARKAREAEIARRKAELARIRQQAIANARQDPQAAARVLMADRGWVSDAQYNCLVNLWNGESGWNYRAQNGGSGAYGIPQSLPGSKMAAFGSDWRTNPITQIKWGLWYIQQTYGNPCNAWSTWQARSPHWY